MKPLLQGLERYGIGLRTQTEDDFWRICREEDIEVVWSRKRFAFYFTVPEQDLRIIVLPSRQTGIQLLFSMFHELGHHLLHGGDEPCVAFRGLSDRKCEAEADAVALLAILPRHELQRIDPEDLLPRSFAKKVLKERTKLEFLYDL
ncbi:MAG: ImmA/IrrE family metallo-endopeptidase [Pyrinomonadaceae bacterium]